jgi:Rrf2 family protein
MKMSDGVEQAIHSVAMLAGLQANGVLSAGALAEFHGVSTSYLLKHLQALSGAGLLIAQPGPTGGYRLARTPDQITLLDVVLAVEGRRARVPLQPKSASAGPIPCPANPRRPAASMPRCCVPSASIAMSWPR